LIQTRLEVINLENEEMQIDTARRADSALYMLKSSNDMLNQIFSYIPGYDIIHKFAVVDKRFRNLL